MDKCDFCHQEKEGVRVYATDYAPVSLCYCPDCSNVPNIRPREIAIFGWGRLGEKYLTPRVWSEIGGDDDTEYPPMVYSEGKYMTVKELIENITEEQIKDWVKWDYRASVAIKRIKKEK